MNFKLGNGNVKGESSNMARVWDKVKNLGATAEYPATIVPDCTCAHIFKERDM